MLDHMFFHSISEKYIKTSSNKCPFKIDISNRLIIRNTYTNIINVKVVMLLCSHDPCNNIVGSNIWKDVRPLGFISNPSWKCPWKTFKIKALNH